MQKVNSSQQKKIYAIRHGYESLPENLEELSCWLHDLILTPDHESIEAPLIDKARFQFVKMAMQKCDDLGFTYLSVINSVISKRKYYKVLSDSMKARKISSPSKYIARALADDGLLKIHGLQVMATHQGREFVSKIEQDKLI